MTSTAIRSKAEAQEQLRRLEQFYDAPVLSLGDFCKTMGTWMDCIVKNSTDPVLKQGGIKHAEEYYKFLNQMRIDIMKSNLLGRLFYAKEPLRTRMCPLHKGHYNGEAMFFEKCPHLCDGTGWLRERPEDRGYKGIEITEAETRREGGELQVKDPKTGKWERLE